MADLLAIFAKAPVPGQVKTRLTPPLTPDEAAAVYEACLRDVIDASLAAAPQVMLFYDDPAGSGGFFRDAFPTLRTRPQAGHDLGTRLENAFSHAVEQRYERILIIGGDSPTLPPEHLQHAMNSLETADVALGPTEDGGYYLIGISRRAWPRSHVVLRGIPWSTGAVFERTMEAARDDSLDLAVAPRWYDIDRPEDLQRAAAEAMEESHLGRLLRGSPGILRTISGERAR